MVELNSHEPKSDLKLHFKEFMKPTAAVKRARSFSQPRDKNSSDREVKPKSGSLIRRKTEVKNEDEEVEDTEEKGMEDGVQNEKVKLRRTSRPTKRGDQELVKGGLDSTGGSSLSGSERASTASNVSSEEVNFHDKPVPDEPDNKEISEISDHSRKSSVTSVERLPPQPPKYKPSLEPSGSTSSYYARVRTRAENSRRKDSTVGTTGTDPASSAPGSSTVSRKFDPTSRKFR